MKDCANAFPGTYQVDEFPNGEHRILCRQQLGNYAYIAFAQGITLPSDPPDEWYVDNDCLQVCYPDDLDPFALYTAIIEETKKLYQWICTLPKCKTTAVIDKYNGTEYKKITVSRDSYNYLMTTVFGNADDPYIAASRKAYSDICDRIRFEKTNSKKRIALRDRSCDFIRKTLSENRRNYTLGKGNGYDRLHRSLCEEIIAAYHEAGIHLSVGLAQYWINNTVELLGQYFKDSASFLGIYAHIPIDDVTVEAAEKVYSIKPPETAWYEIDSYDVYLDYQHRLLRVVQYGRQTWHVRAIIEKMKGR